MPRSGSLSLSRLIRKGFRSGKDKEEAKPAQNKDNADNDGDKTPPPYRRTNPQSSSGLLVPPGLNKRQSGSSIATVVTLEDQTLERDVTAIAKPEPGLEPEPTLAEVLWDRAYENLRSDEPSLVTGFEKVLLRRMRETGALGDEIDPEEDTIGQLDRRVRQAQLQLMIHAGLKKTEREAKVKASVGTAMQVVMSAKKIIDQAIQAAPQAALPWAGVSIALEILMNPLEASEANRKGIVYVVSRMDWYWELASHLLEENTVDGGSSAGLRFELERRIVDLYKALLSYQMMTVCSFFRNRGVDFLRALVNLDDWDASLTAIHDAERDLREDSNSYTNQQTRYLLEQLVISKKHELELLKQMNGPKSSGEPTGPEPASKRKYHRVLPFGRNKDFVERKSILERIMECVHPDTDPEDCQRVAIEGLGGVGKTQLALEAAFRVQDCSVFWVPAVDMAAFENAYRDIGISLGVVGTEERSEDVRMLVRKALSDEGSGKWLLIIDNADDIGLLFDNTESVPLTEYLPFSYRGSILFTTRNHEAVVRLGIPRRNVIDTAVMSRDESLALLKKDLSEDQTQDSKSTTKLLDFLGDLPLAIKQASAYMATKQISTSEYLELCQASDLDTIDLLSREFEDRYRYKETKNPVATTWLISFAQVEDRDPLAAEYLRFMSFLAEKDIPKSILPEARKVQAAEAIGTLKAYAFITERKGSASYDIHRLVSLTMRNWLEEKGEFEDELAKVYKRITKVFPFPKHENREVWMKYQPHAQVALRYKAHSSDKIAESKVLFNMGESYYLLGRYQEAESSYRQSLAIRKEHLGERNSVTYQTMNNLAINLKQRAKFKEAEKLHREVLAMREEELGNEHTDTIQSRDNLGVTLKNLGRYKEAEDIHRANWEILERVLGKEHAKTLQSKNNLAVALQNQKQYEEAETLFREILEVRARKLGELHPSTLQSRNNLAVILRRLKKYPEAEAIHRDVLQRREQILGKEHPDTLQSLNNLAVTVQNLKKYDEAEKLHRENLVMRSKVLGPEHPDTLQSKANVAAVLGARGKHAEAEKLHREVLRSREKVLGKNHPTTNESRANHANSSKKAALLKSPRASDSKEKAAS